MATPFSARTNATLRFEVSSGVLATDPVTGNVKPTAVVMVVQAMLNQKSRANRERRPGVDVTAVYLEGFVTEVVGLGTAALPPIVTPDSPCQAVWDGKNGQFFMELTGRSSYGVEAITGDKIKGFFQLSSFAVEGDLWMPIGVPRKLKREVFTVEQAGQTSFTLSATAQSPEMSEFYVNGVKATYPLEYTIDGTQLSWIENDLQLQPGDEIEVLYYQV